MEEDGVSREYEYVGSEEEDSLEGSIESVTDESSSIVRGSDSDSSIATKCSTLGRGENPHSLAWPRSLRYTSYTAIHHTRRVLIARELKREGVHFGA